MEGNSNGAGLVIGAGLAINAGSSTASASTISRNTIYSLSNNSGTANNSIYAIDLTMPQPAATTLAASSIVGATNVKVASVTGAAVGGTMTVEATGANPETVTITVVGTSGAGGTGITFTPALAFAHALGASVQYNNLAGNLVERNFVHSISLSSSDTSSQLWGIVMRGQGRGTFQNNMIRLGIADGGNSITSGYSIIGIRDISGSVRADYYDNSVYIGGTGVASASNTFCFLSSGVTNTRNFKDNIFWNARSNASGGYRQFCNWCGWHRA